MTEGCLILVYASLTEIADEYESWDSSDVSQRAELSLQETEIRLDELEHMGFVERRNERWYPTAHLIKKDPD